MCCFICANICAVNLHIMCIINYCFIHSNLCSETAKLWVLFRWCNDVYETEKENWHNDRIENQWLCPHLASALSERLSSQWQCYRSPSCFIHSLKIKFKKILLRFIMIVILATVVHIFPPSCLCSCWICNSLITTCSWAE